MKHKMILLGLAAACAAMFALPAAASAGTWKLDPPGEKITVSSVGNTVLKTANHTITCTSSTGTGTINATGTGGTGTLKFHSCKDEAGTTCTGENAGEPSGTITTNSVTLSNVYLEKEEHTPGVTLAPSSGTSFAKFTCAFGLLTVNVTGSVIGRVESCAAGASVPITFEATAHGVQKWTQVTTTGTVDDLVSDIGSSSETASQEGTGFVKLASGANLTPTCRL